VEALLTEYLKELTMIDPGASAAAQEAAAVMPVTTGEISLADAFCLPRRPETPGTEGPAKPGPADPAALPDPPPENSPIPEAVSQDAATAHRLAIAPAFQAAMKMNRLPFDTSACWARHIPQVTAPFWATSAAFSLPRLNIAVNHILPVIRADLRFRQAIATMPAAWNLGLRQHNYQLGNSMTGMLAPHHELIRNLGSLIPAVTIAGVARSVNLTAVSAMPGLVGLFQHWRELADFGTGLLRGVARAAYTAALHARAAVLRGDNGPVAQFIENWLNLRATPGRIEAVSAALLEEGWDASVPDNPGQLLTDLRRRTGRQARVLRPIWETQLNHRTVGMLDQPVSTRAGTTCTVADLVRDPRTTENVALTGTRDHEQRLHQVLDQLKPDELTITNIYAQRDNLTWAEAARAAGAADPATKGERVRRKLKRLGTEHQRRLILQPART
jgi:hypothetical protein